MAPPLTIRDLPKLPRISRHFWPYVRKRWLLLAGSTAALLAQAGLQVLEPWPLKFIFDRVIAPPQRGSGNAIVDALDPMVVLTLAALGLVAITGLRAFASYLATVGFALAGNRVLADVRAALYRHLQYLSLSFHARAKSGELSLRVMSDVGIINDVAVTAIPQLAATILVLAGMLVLMLWMQWQLALLALALAPLFWRRTTHLSRQIQDASRAQRQRDGALAATTVESISAIKVVQALSLESVFASTFSSANEKSLREGVRASRLAATLERSVDMLIAVDTAIVLWFGARLVLEHALTAGELLVFLAYLRSAFRPMRDFAKYAARLAKATAAGERVVDVFDQIPDVRTMPDAVPAPRLAGAIGFDAVTFTYEPGRDALADVSFDVRPGERIAITGPSGGGKSTLASLVLRLYDPQRGVVRVDGRDVRDYELESYRAQISIVLQDTILFAASVRDNIAYGVPQATAAEIEAAALLANADRFIETLPDGYETLLGERGATLSGGQRQRISLARAAVRRSAILILDEPTTSLDEENARVVTLAIEGIARDRTTLLISHDLDLVARCDQILYLDDGRIVERGTHAELLRADGTYARAYRALAATQRRRERVAG